jgi:pimeloyl-ACP methyl ester carboxylesterase
MSTMRLLRWLGPWTSQQRAPKGIVRESHMLEKNIDMEMWVYSHPHRQKGAIFVIPGIHYEGPSDVRLDRFCRVLADSGMVVCCPFIPSMISLVMNKNVLQEVEVSFRSFLSIVPDMEVGIFSISAASISALHLGATPDFKSRIRAIHLFGGFSDWSEALIFSMTGLLSIGGTVRIDPLGLPVVFLNVFSANDMDEESRNVITKAWIDFVNKTWEKPNKQDYSVYSEIANDIANELPTPLQELFLQGCSVRSGGIEKAKKAVVQFNGDTHWLDPRPVLEKLHYPLYISHGRDDCVVPFTQAQELAQLCPKKLLREVNITGLYHHTGPVGIWEYLKLIPKLPLELYYSIRMVRAIAKTGINI